MPFRVNIRSVEAGIIVLVGWFIVLVGLVGVQYQVINNANSFNRCLQSHSVQLTHHANASNDAIRHFITDASKISKQAASSQAKGASPDSPALRRLRLIYAKDITRLKKELHDSSPPKC